MAHRNGVNILGVFSETPVLINDPVDKLDTLPVRYFMSDNNTDVIQWTKGARFGCTRFREFLHVFIETLKENSLDHNTIEGAGLQSYIELIQHLL